MTRNEIKSNFELFFFSDQTSLFVSTFSAGNYAYYEPANQFSASGPVNHRLFELVTDRGVGGCACFGVVSKGDFQSIFPQPPAAQLNFLHSMKLAFSQFTVATTQYYILTICTAKCTAGGKLSNKFSMTKLASFSYQTLSFQGHHYYAIALIFI